MLRKKVLLPCLFLLIPGTYQLRRRRFIVASFLLLLGVACMALLFGQEGRVGQALAEILLVLILFLNWAEIYRRGYSFRLTCLQRPLKKGLFSLISSSKKQRKTTSPNERGGGGKEQQGKRLQRFGSFPSS